MALAISTVVAVTVVSIEIARAEISGAAAAGSDSQLAIALFLGVVLTGMGGLTVLTTLHSMRKPRRD